jgi:hypothetical protein
VFGLQTGDICSRQLLTVTGVDWVAAVIMVRYPGSVVVEHLKAVAKQKAAQLRGNKAPRPKSGKQHA